MDYLQRNSCPVPEPYRILESAGTYPTLPPNPFENDNRRFIIIELSGQIGRTGLSIRLSS